MPKLLLPLVAVFAIAGCKVSPPIEGRADPYASPQVTFASKDLRRSTAIGAPMLQRDDAGNLLHVSLPIRATGATRLYVDYKIAFYDRNGGLLSETGWQSKTLEGNTPETLSANSTSPQAADFRLALRWSH